MGLVPSDIGDAIIRQTVRDKYSAKFTEVRAQIAVQGFAVSLARLSRTLKVAGWKAEITRARIRTSESVPTHWIYSSRRAEFDNE
jgi:hypothetical protein